MAYEKQTWVTGEVITKEKLNHMEDGIANSGGGMFIVNVDEDNKLDKTWNEIMNAFKNGLVPAIAKYSVQRNRVRFQIVNVVMQTGEHEWSVSSYEVNEAGSILPHNFRTDDADGYPSDR